jgi:hypothetical protein
MTPSLALARPAGYRYRLGPSRWCKTRKIGTLGVRVGLSADGAQVCPGLVRADVAAPFALVGSRLAALIGGRTTDGRSGVDRPAMDSECHRLGRAAVVGQRSEVGVDGDHIVLGGAQPALGRRAALEVIAAVDDPSVAIGAVRR